MAKEFSSQWLFRGDAFTTLLFAMIVFFAIKETAPSAKSDDPRTGLPDPSVGPAAGSSSIDALRDMRHNVRFIVFCLSVVLAASVFSQSMSTMPLHMRGLGYELTIYGWVIAVNGMLITVCQLPLTVLLTRFNRIRVTAMGVLLMGIGFGCMRFAILPWHFVLTVIIFVFYK